MEKKLTKKQVKEIRELALNNPISAIAHDYGLGWKKTRNIIQGRTYTDYDGPIQPRPKTNSKKTRKRKNSELTPDMLVKVLRLYYLENLTVKEIARAFELPNSFVNKTVELFPKAIALKLVKAA